MADPRFEVPFTTSTFHLVRSYAMLQLSHIASRVPGVDPSEVSHLKQTLSRMDSREFFLAVAVLGQVYELITEALLENEEGHDDFFIVFHVEESE